MKKIMIMILLIFYASADGMEMPPTPSAIPAQESIGWHNVPGDIKRIIQTMVLHGVAKNNLQETVTNLNNFALVNKDFYAYLNSPSNIIELITSIAQKTPGKDEIDIAQGLRNMRGMQDSAVIQWLTQRRRERARERLARNMFFMFHWQPEKIKEKIAQGVNINARDANGKTILHYAIGPNSARDISVLRYLLQAGADVNAQDKAGKTPLMEAVIPGYPSIIDELLRNNADVNIQDQNGWTALMEVIFFIRKYKADSGTLETIKKLLQAKPNLNLRNKSGETALDMAKNTNNPEVINLIEASMEVIP